MENDVLIEYGQNSVLNLYSEIHTCRWLCQYGYQLTEYSKPINFFFSEDIDVYCPTHRTPSYYYTHTN